MSTPEFFDREYNARSAIPDALDIFARWRRRSDEARARLPGLKDLGYGDSPGQNLDLFWCLQPDRPLFVFIHGGYWRALHKDDFGWVAEPFVAAGVNVAVINYDLVPQVDLETLTLQVLRSLVFLHDHAEALDFDPAQIHVGGHSAGGHLTAMCLAARWKDWRADLPADLVKSGVAISGLFDLAPIAQAPFLNNDLKLTDARVKALSPSGMPPAAGTRLLLSVGGLESSEFHRQSELLTQAWGDQISMSQVAAPGRHHLSVCEALAEPGHPLFQQALAQIAPTR